MCKSILHVWYPLWFACNTTKARWRLRTTCTVNTYMYIHSCLAAPTYHLRPRTHSDQPILVHFLTLVSKERDERYATCGGARGKGGGEDRQACGHDRRNNEGFCRRTRTTNGHSYVLHGQTKNALPGSRSSLAPIQPGHRRRGCRSRWLFM